MYKVKRFSKEEDREERRRMRLDTPLENSHRGMGRTLAATGAMNWAASPVVDKKLKQDLKLLKQTDPSGYKATKKLMKDEGMLGSKARSAGRMAGAMAGAALSKKGVEKDWEAGYSKPEIVNRATARGAGYGAAAGVVANARGTVRHALKGNYKKAAVWAAKDALISGSAAGLGARKNAKSRIEATEKKQAR